jgi:uncharacterized RDD family membrane protein YckC
MPHGPAADVDEDPAWDPQVGPDEADVDAAPPGEEGERLPDLDTTSAPRTGRASAWSQSLTSSESIPGPAGLWLAEMPDRIIAFVLDVIALAVVGMILAIVLGGLFGGLVSGGTTVGGALDDAGGDLNLGAFLVVGVVATAISFVYFTYSWVVLRSTPGMRLLGLRIGDQRDGRPISWDQALIRWLILGIAATLVTFAVYVPSLLGLSLGVLGLVWLVVVLVTINRSPMKQGLHDRYARTILVRATRRPG